MLIKSLYTASLLLVMFLIGFLCQTAAHLLHLPIDLTANKGAGQVLLYVIVIGTIVLFTTKIWKQDISAAVRQYSGVSGRIAKGFWTCAGISLLLQLPIYGLLFHAGILDISDYARHKSIPTLVINILISQIVMVVLATSEEGIFRGFLFNYLRGDWKKGNVAAAVVISSIIFGLSHEFHTLNHWLEPAYYGKLIGLVLLGVLLAVTYQSTRSIACSIGVHASLLWLDENRRVTMDLHQSYWWTGTNNDLRTAPFVWLIFLTLTIGFGLSGKRLRPVFAVEGRDDDFAPIYKEIEEPSTSPVAPAAAAYKAATTVE
jgi:membrane protease YdiL (CAAX protease family)